MNVLSLFKNNHEKQVESCKDQYAHLVGRYIAAAVTDALSWGYQGGFPYSVVSKVTPIYGLVKRVGERSIVVEVEGVDRAYGIDSSIVGGIRIIEDYE